MYDLSSELNKFYRSEVVLPADDQHSLRERKKLNIKRLKEGLLEYNSENGTDYKICENRVQGSMAMHTVVQNDAADYDIDVAIVFERNNLGELGPLQARRMVADALKRKTKQFANEPLVKTSCVRLTYQEGYHLDFAVYRRYKKNKKDQEYTYEHAGAEWSVRGIRAVEDWFNDELDDKGDDLRKIVRLSKMFCKSRGSYVNMPSGIVQTVLCNEQLSEDDRIDEKFYNSMSRIVSRLEASVEVEAPVDNGRALVTRESDKTKMNNWKNRLSKQLEDMGVLFQDNCTKEDAIKAWGGFFNHSYWTELIKETVAKSQVSEAFSSSSVRIRFNDTEQFIEDLYPVSEIYDVDIDCKVEGNGFRQMPIVRYLEVFAPKLKKYIPHHFSVYCSIAATTAPSYDKVLWKVKNNGSEAERRNDIRGQILDRGNSIIENTKFWGPHYIECYLIKDDICIAIGHVNVPIGNE